MSTLSLTVAGLIAVIVKSDLTSAAFALMDYPAHKHFPILLIPRAAVVPQQMPALLKELPDPSPLLVKAKLPGQIADYVALDVTGINLALTSQPAGGGLALYQPPLPPSGCPQGNWESLSWLLDLNSAVAKTSVGLTQGALQNAPSIATLVQVTDGELRGHSPVEVASKTRRYAYGAMTPRAVTDAALWTAKVKGDVVLSLASRSTKKVETITLKGDVEALLLNLPDPSLGGATPGGHLPAFQSLPFNDGTIIQGVAEAGVCASIAPDQMNHSGGDALNITVSMSGAHPSQVSVSVTAQYGEHEVVATHQHGTGGPMKPSGDSLCMGLRIISDAF